jgi:ATP-binding cassette, subfamily B, bacterial
MLDRILVFEAGRVVEEGTHEELVRREGGTYRRLFERQALGLVVDDEEEAFDGEFSDDAVNY